ncbi:replication initiation protein [Lactobacillus jensenii]|uniref:replication initiation protein n=1 Tax=Lactobacillus jensenii TaxID=109790 RepID=UPI0034D97A2C
MILSKTADQLAAYQKEQIQKKVKALNLDKNDLDKKTLTRIASEVKFPTDLVTRVTYSEIDHAIGYDNNNASIGTYIEDMKNKLEKWREIKVDGITASFPMFKGIINNTNKKYFEFVYNDFMINILLINPKTGDFVRYPAREIVDLSSVRSQTLLRLLKQLRTVGSITFRKHIEKTNSKTRIGLWEQLEIPEKTREGKF